MVTKEIAATKKLSCEVYIATVLEKAVVNKLDSVCETWVLLQQRGALGALVFSFRFQYDQHALK